MYIYILKATFIIKGLSTQNVNFYFNTHIYYFITYYVMDIASKYYDYCIEIDLVVRYTLLFYEKSYLLSKVIQLMVRGKDP